MAFPLLAALPSLLQGIMGAGAAGATGGASSLMGGAGAGAGLGEGMKGLFDIGAGGTFGGAPLPPGGFDAPASGAPPGMPGPEEIPSAPSAPFKPGDVSSFASAGLTPPELPGAQKQLGGLMAMVNQPFQQRTNQQRLPPGGLMQYLQDLSRS